MKKLKPSPRWRQELKAIGRELREIRSLVAAAMPAPTHVYHTGDARYGTQHRFNCDKCWCEPEVRWEDGEYMIVVHRRVQ